MAKYTYTSIDSLTNESSAITQINRNFAALQTALENTLSRNGTTPNTMTANLDMNSKRIVNLAAPVGSSDAVRKIDLQDAVFGDYTPVVEDTLSVLDGVAEPSVSAGRALIYVDTVDGDLKVKFSDEYSPFFSNPADLIFFIFSTKPLTLLITLSYSPSLYIDSILSVTFIIFEDLFFIFS